MANLIVRNVDNGVTQTLKQRASTHGVSAEVEHRSILQQALLQPKRCSFLQVLAEIPDVVCDEDFERFPAY